MEKNRTIRVTVVGVEDVFMSHATVVGGEGSGMSTTSEPRLTEEAAVVECLTKMARALTRPDEVSRETGDVAVGGRV